MATTPKVFGLPGLAPAFAPYRLVDRAIGLGWPHERVQVIDEDLGKSGAGGVDRQLIAEIGLGNAGL